LVSTCAPHRGRADHTAGAVRRATTPGRLPPAPALAAISFLYIEGLDGPEPIQLSRRRSHFISMVPAGTSEAVAQLPGEVPGPAERERETPIPLSCAARVTASSWSVTAQPPSTRFDSTTRR
jgi:hypothetical protein